MPPTSPSPAAGGAGAAPVTPPTGPEVKAAIAYVKDLAARRYDAAYLRLSPLSRMFVTKGQWERSFAPTSNQGPGSFPYILAGARDYTVAPAQLQGEQGTARVTLRGTKPLPVRLIEQDGEWWVDWTDEGQAQRRPEEDLKDFTDQSLTGMMSAHGQNVNPTAWAGSPLLRELKAVSSVKRGRMAVVEITGEATAQAVVPVSKTEGVWKINWEEGRMLPQTGKGADVKTAKKKRRR